MPEINDKIDEIRALYKQGFYDAVVLEADLLVQLLIIRLCERFGCSVEISEGERSQERMVLTSRLSAKGITFSDNVNALRRLRNNLEHPEAKSETTVGASQSKAAAKAAVGAVNEVITIVNKTGRNAVEE